MSVAPQYQQDCNALCTAAQSARAAPMQPRSNREKERPKYYTLLQLAQGGHPPPCSTMHYGQVQNKMVIKTVQYVRFPVLSVLMI
jgi:hypothetical protein